jgi:hypothetical protein
MQFKRDELLFGFLKVHLRHVLLCFPFFLTECDGFYSYYYLKKENRVINHLKPNGNYMSHLLQQSVILHFVFRPCGIRMILIVNSDYFLKQR